MFLWTGDLCIHCCAYKASVLCVPTGCVHVVLSECRSTAITILAIQPLKSVVSVATRLRTPEAQCAQHCAKAAPTAQLESTCRSACSLKLCRVGDVSHSASFNPMLQRSKAAAMYWTSPKLLESCHVSSSPIALMLCKAIQGPLLMILIHQLVPGHLCKVSQAVSHSMLQ